MEETTPLASESLLSSKCIHSIFTKAQNSFLLINQVGEILMINNFACNYLGYKQEEFLNKHLQEIIINSSKNILNTILESLQTNTPITEEGLAINREGRIMPIAYTIVPCDTINEANVLFVSITDLTEKEQLENFLSQTNRVARVGGWEYYMPDRNAYWTDVTKEIHDLPLDYEPNVEKAIEFYAGEEERKIIIDLVAKIETTGEPFDVELRIKTAKGRICWIRAKAEAQFINGKCVKVFGTFQDIHEKKLIQQQNEKNSQEHNKLMDISMDIICTIDGEGKFVTVSNASQNIWGYTPQELIGKKYIEMVHPEDVAKTTGEAESIIAGNAIINFENRYIKKNGDCIYMSWSARWDEKNQLNYCVARDITANKKIEYEKEILIQELTKSNKDLKQFTYITSHNMRSPLTNLVSIASMIDVEKIEDAFTKQLINGFKISTKNLNDTLNDLIKILIVKENNGQLKSTVTFSTVLHEVLSSISQIIEQSNARIDVDFSHAQTVVFNHAYLESIFLNLITNSIKYAKVATPAEINISTKIEEKKVKLIIVDNGLGMDMDKVKNKLFGLYQKFHNHPDSKGIGLYLVHAQITSLGGDISVISEPNKGTTFTITFA